MLIFISLVLVFYKNYTIHNMRFITNNINVDDNPQYNSYYLDHIGTINSTRHNAMCKSWHIAHCYVKLEIYIMSLIDYGRY